MKKKQKKQLRLYNEVSDLLGNLATRTWIEVNPENDEI